MTLTCVEIAITCRYHHVARPLAELKDALKEKKRRLQELKADLDNANDLVPGQDEHVQDSAEMIKAWKAAVEMELRDGVWVWNES